MSTSFFVHEMVMIEFEVMVGQRTKVAHLFVLWKRRLGYGTAEFLKFVGCAVSGVTP